MMMIDKLVDCAATRFSKPTCQFIELGYGNYNTVYKLVFADGTEIVASVGRPARSWR